MSVPSRLRHLLNRNNRPLRFLVAGGLNTVFGIMLFPLLISVDSWFKHHYLLTLMIAQAASISFAYLTYNIALKGGNISFRQVGFFSSFYIFHCATNIMLLPVLVEIFGVNPIVAQLSFIVFMAVGGYLWHSRITFAAARDDKVQARR